MTQGPPDKLHAQMAHRIYRVRMLEWSSGTCIRRMTWHAMSLRLQGLQSCI